MSNLRDLFKTTNIDKIPPYFWEKDRTICYYPSSGDDFRHIFYWDYYCNKENIQYPDIFIHTYFTCLDWNHYPKEYMGLFRIMYEFLEKEGKPLRRPLLYNEYILDIFDRDYSIVIKAGTNCFLKTIYFPKQRHLFFLYRN